MHFPRYASILWVAFMSTATPAFDHRDQVRLVWLAAILAAGMTLAVLIAVNLEQHPASPVRTSEQPIVATPTSFRDVAGIVQNIRGQTITLDVVITDANGRIRHRTFNVTAEKNTTIEKLQGHTLTPTSFSALAVHDQVQAAADVNIAPLNHFTATKILQLISSS